MISILEKESREKIIEDISVDIEIYFECSSKLIDECNWMFVEFDIRSFRHTYNGFDPLKQIVASFVFLIESKWLL